MKTRRYGTLAAALVLVCCMAAENVEPNPVIPGKTAIETLVQQAASFQDGKQPDSALVYARRAKDMAEGATDIPELLKAEVFDRLGQCHFDQRDHDSAGLYLNEALAIAEKENDDPLTSDILIHLGKVCFRERAWDQAADHLRRALALKENTFGPDNEALMYPLLVLIKIYYRQFHYMDAEPLCLRLVTIAMATEGPASPKLIEAYTYLGWVAEDQSQFDMAQVYYRRAISIAECQSPVDYKGLAEIYGVLSQAYLDGWNFTAAEEAALRALAIAEQHVGKNSPVTAQVMMRLVTMYSEYERYDLAESYARRALAIRQAWQPVNKEDVIESLFALGFVYRAQQRYTEAVAYYRMTCDMTLATFGPEDPFLMRYQFALAEVYYLSGQTSEAEKLLLQYMPVFEKVMGSANYINVWTVRLLAEIRMHQGRYAEAETLLLGRLAAMEQAYGPRYYCVGDLLEALMRYYTYINAPDKALQSGERILRLRRDLAEKMFVSSSESQKLSWVERNPVVISELLSLAVAHPGRQADSVAFDMVLHGKAIVFDAIMEEKEVAFCSADTVVGAGIKKRAGLCTAIADLAVGSDGAPRRDSVREELARLYDTLETVEADLSRECSDFGTAMAERDVSFAQVGDCLPSGGILLEYVKYEADTSVAEYSSEYIPPVMRYLVFILDRAGRVTLTDLGEAAEIDSLIAQARQMIYDAERRIYSPMAPYLEERLNEVTSVLYQRLVAPVESKLAGATGIFIAPDDMLNLLPFDILPKPDGSYLIEHYRLSYLSSGRDLMHFGHQFATGQGAMILGDPDYDLATDSPPSPVAEDNSLLASLSSSSGASRHSTGVSSASGRRFLPLQYSREESMAIASTIGRKGRMPVREWFGVDAREDWLKRTAVPPRILHFSTHGYFAAAPPAGEQPHDNPLLRSGLALAGANRMPPLPRDDTLSSDDGMLTALEVSGLDLHGTDLVALSACETGVGEPSAGEGVFGLRRAFLHAGAQSVVMSLWNVPDRETAELMTRFYELWLGGMSKSEALHASALEILKKMRVEKGHGHPLFWGGFVLIGDPN
jgi:CHAT domain-containing protein/tetratricopeptide (TPR) repeat protein